MQSLEPPQLSRPPETQAPAQMQCPQDTLAPAADYTQHRRKRIACGKRTYPSQTLRRRSPPQTQCPQDTQAPAAIEVPAGNAGTRQKRRHPSQT